MGWLRDRITGLSRAQMAALPAVQHRVEPRAEAIQSSGGGVTITTPDQLSEALRQGYTTMSGESVTPHTAMKVGAVYACVRLLAGLPANMPLDVGRRVSETIREPASDHQVYRLMRRRPNRWQTPSQFKRMLEVHKQLRGNGYAQIVWSLGRPIELIPLNPDRVTVRQLDDLTLEYDYVGPNGRCIVFKQREIFHLVGMTLDGVRGVTPITYARETIGAAIATERHGANVFRNGAQIGKVFKMPAGAALSDPAYARLKASLQDYRADGDEAGGVMLLEEGMDVESMAMTAEDAQWIESRKLSRSDIAMFFGVPPSMIGDNSGSDSNWGTGLEQKTQGFITFVGEDVLVCWEETVERDLLTDDDAKIYVRFNRAALLRGDLKARKEFYTAALQWGWMNPDEVRAFEDLNPRADGKGGRYYDPPNTAGRPAQNKDNDDDAA